MRAGLSTSTASEPFQGSDRREMFRLSLGDGIITLESAGIT